MVRLPSPEDIALGSPQVRGANSVQAVRAQETQPDLAPGRLLSDLGELAYKETQKLDALKAEDALNQIRQARLDLTMGDQGAYSVKGGGVLDTGYAANYKSRLATTTEGIMATLSPSQQARLKPHADNEMTGFQTDVLRHSMTEAERYKGLVRQGTLETAANAGIEQWADPIAFTKSLDDINTTVMGIAKEQGITGKTDGEKDTLIAMQRKAMSPMLVGAITKALDVKTPEALKRAEQLYNDGGIRLDPSARLQLGEHLQKAKDALAVQTDTTSYLTNVVAPLNTPLGRLNGALLSTSITSAESGKQPHYAAGKVLLGPVIQGGPRKGEQAVGKHQIMPTSAVQDAKEAGLPWDEKLFYAATPEGEAYHNALQAAHVSRLTRMFGTPVEVAAAYNAGEGNVIKAKEAFARYQGMAELAKTDPSAKPVAPGGYNPAEGPISFLDFLPKPSETKPYVARAMSAYAAAPDLVKPSTKAVEDVMRAKYPNRPDLVAEASRIVAHQLTTIEQARKDEIEAGKDQAYKLMGQGKMFSELPPSLLAKLPVRDQDEVQKTFEAHISGKPRDSNQGLLLNINSDPNYLARLPNSAWNGPLRAQLSEYDWKRFDTQRSSLLGGNTKEPDNLDTGTIGSVLSSRLRMLDIDPTPKDSDKAGMGVVNSARAVIDQSIAERQAQIGRKLSEPEIRQHIDGLFSTSETLRNTLHFITGGTTKTSVMAMSYRDIPSTDRAAIENKLRLKGVTKPTDVQVLTVYKQIKQGLL